MDTTAFYEYLRSFTPTQVVENKEFVKKEIYNFFKQNPLETDKAATYYVMQLDNHNFLYVSDHMATYGFDIKRIYEEGDKYLDTFFIPEGIKIRDEQIEPKLKELLFSIPPPELPLWHFSFDFKMKTPNGDVKKFLQTFMIVIDKNNLPFLIFSKVADVTEYNFNEKTTLVATKVTGDKREKMVFEYYLPQDYSFSNREKEILKFVQSGLSSKEIADKLNISVNTVKNHRQNMLTKTGCSNMLEIINKAKEAGEI